jgi:hypothetical protein
LRLPNLNIKSDYTDILRQHMMMVSISFVHCMYKDEGLAMVSLAPTQVRSLTSDLFHFLLHDG